MTLPPYNPRHHFPWSFICCLTRAKHVFDIATNGNKWLPKVVSGLGSFRFARRYSGNAKTFYRIGNGRRHSKKSVYWFLFLQVLRCFNSLGSLQVLADLMTEVYSAGSPHSDISGSKVARHLPEALRSRATSFIASSSQGIHRTPLGLLLGNLITATYEHRDRSVRMRCCPVR